VALNEPLIVLVPTNPGPGSRFAENVPATPAADADVTVMDPLPNATFAIQLPVPAEHERV
jgi:hypothetical protein